MGDLAQEALANRAAPEVAGANAATAAALETVPTSTTDFVDDPEASNPVAAGAGEDLPDLGTDAAPAGNQATADPLIEALRGRNLDVDEYSGDQFLEEVHQTFTENERLAQENQQLRARLESGGSPSGAAKGVSPELPSAATHTPATVELPAWNRPAFDKRMLQFLERDPETNQIRVVPGGDPTILRQYHEYQNWRAEIADRWESNPGEFIRPFVESIVKPLIERAGAGVEQKLQSQVQAEREQELLDRTLYQNGYLALNADGSVKRHPVTSRVIQTPEGTQFLKEFHTLLQENPSMSRARAIDLAARLAPGKPRTAARPAAATTQTSPSARPQSAPERKTIGDRMRSATRTPSAARNRVADSETEDRVPSMDEIQRDLLARK